MPCITKSTTVTDCNNFIICGVVGCLDTREIGIAAFESARARTITEFLGKRGISR
jgi:hypothetical protein